MRMLKCQFKMFTTEAARNKSVRELEQESSRGIVLLPEIKAQFQLTEEDVNWWINQFFRGRLIFSLHIGEHNPLQIKMFLCPSYIDQGKNRYQVVGYDTERDIFVVTFEFIRSHVAAMKKYQLGDGNLRSSNGHLWRMGLCTLPELAPVFIGIEEEAHAYYSHNIRPQLGFLSQEVRTGLYDGSDPYEEYVYQQLQNIIHKGAADLPVFPLPANVEVME